MTDAHLALNRLGTRSMIGGQMILNREAAVAAIERVIAAPLGLDWMRAAQGILQITTSNIMRAVRAMSVERGRDPRHMTLLAFGGAGPLHALDVARALGIPRVVVPPCAGVWSAYGILSVDIEYAVQRTWFRALRDDVADDLGAVIGAMTDELMQRAIDDDAQRVELAHEHALDLRVQGQSHCITVALSAATRAALASAEHAFHDEHERRFGHAYRDLTLEIVNVRTALIAARSGIDGRSAIQKKELPGAPGERELWLEGERDPRCCSVFGPEHLIAGTILAGPAVIEQYDTTVVLAPGDRLRCETVPLPCSSTWPQSKDSVDSMAARANAWGAIAMWFIVSSVARAAAAEPLRILSDPDYPPISFADGTGRLIGFDPDFAKGLAQHLGRPLDYIGVAWDGIVPALQAGKADAVTNMAITAKRREIVDFSMPFLAQSIAVVVRKDAQGTAPTLANLASLRIGVMMNTSAAGAVVKLPAVRPILYASVADEYTDLLLGRLDIVAIESINGAYTVAHSYAGRLRMTDLTMSTEKQEIGVAIRKGNPLLLQQIDAAIVAMRRDGSLDAIAIKWFGDTRILSRP